MCLYCISPAPVDGRKGKMRSVGPALLFLPFEVDLLAPLFFPQLLSSFYLRFVLCFLLSFLTRAECSFPPFLQPLFSSLSARRPPFVQGACVCLTSYRKKKNVRVRARLSLLLAHFISSLFFNDSYIYIYVCRLCCGDHVSHAVSPPPPPPIL